MNFRDSEKQKKLRVAELTSGVGALVLGVGLGSYFADRIGGYSILAMIIGALSHGWGMYDKNRMEKEFNPVSVWWETALYWLCWFLLAFLGIYLVVR